MRDKIHIEPMEAILLFAGEVFMVAMLIGWLTTSHWLFAAGLGTATYFVISILLENVDEEKAKQALHKKRRF